MNNHNDPTLTKKLSPPAAWRLERQTGSGDFIMASGRLGRLDRASGCLFLWDKKIGAEVAVKLTDLLALCQAGS